MSLPWPEEKVAQLVFLHETGLSARAIGAQLGMSKNAVIGRLHRVSTRAKRLLAAKRRREARLARREAARKAEKDLKLAVLSARREAARKAAQEKKRKRAELKLALRSMTKIQRKYFLLLYEVVQNQLLCPSPEELGVLAQHSKERARFILKEMCKRGLIRKFWSPDRELCYELLVGPLRGHSTRVPGAAYVRPSTRTRLEENFPPQFSFRASREAPATRRGDVGYSK
jgi:hypothetical protein